MEQRMIVKGWSCQPGDFVSVRPCADEYENKTFLGIYVGDVAISFNKKTGEPAMNNPCMWVPDIETYIFGCESWWGKIDSSEQLRTITDDDINNVWYVRALKALESNGSVPEGSSGGSDD